jgi:hypothetical protein
LHRVQNLFAQNLFAQNLLAQNLPAQNLLAQNLPAQNLLAQNLLAQKLLAQNLLTQNLLATELACSELSGSELACSELACSELAQNVHAGRVCSDGANFITLAKSDININPTSINILKHFLHLSNELYIGQALPVPEQIFVLRTGLWPLTATHGVKIDRN